MVSVDASTSDMIMSNPRRSIEEGNLLTSNKTFQIVSANAL